LKNNCYLCGRINNRIRHEEILFKGYYEKGIALCGGDFVLAGGLRHPAGEG
jgi:hypothetical protein